ncbi:MAG: hypothetical protein JW809_09045 [Pirellulales bacterium]|nr:hypothetical protein [Pirellulales bacterium]
MSLLIEQAVFTSAATERSAGYQVVAASPGVSEADVRELAVWGPTHGALIDAGPEGVSFNFHPLENGAYCVSRTTPAGWEYSGRGGVRVYTQCLIVPAEELGRFANNPFAVLRAALAGGALEIHQEVPSRLEPLRLSGRSAAVDSTLLARLAANPGADWMATVIQAALATRCLILAGSPAPEHVIAGVINCLPPECRTEFSFSTGLKYSARRPFRVATAGDDRGERRRIEQQYGATVLDLSGRPPQTFAPIDGWARFIEAVLKSHRTSFLATQFSKRRFALSAKDLPALGLELLEELDASGMSPPEGDARARAKAPDEPPSPRDWLDGLQQAHAAHRRFQGGASLAAVQPGGATTLPEHLDSNNPDVLEKLEKLDDLVFEAIGGNDDALARLRAVWPTLRTQLGANLLDESREQYLRHALFIWEGARDGNSTRDTSHAVQALDVLCVLFDDL